MAEKVKKKILNIVSGNPSGALNISMSISHYLKQQGYDVIDVFRKYNNTDLNGITVIKDRCTIDFVVSLAAFIKSELPDLIIVHGYSTHIWVKMAVAYSGVRVKLIHVEHNAERYTGIRSWLTRKLDKYADKYICVSKGVAAHLAEQGVDESKIEVIYNGIDIEKFNLPKEPHDVFTVGMVARFSKQKDQMTLIKAVELLVKEKNEKIKLLLMGEGKTKEKCKAYVKENGLEDVVTFMEGRFVDLITKVDVFVLSTHVEGLPLVLCEAMASKTPVIATDIPGVDEIVEDNKTGLLFKEGDYIALEYSILRLKNNNYINDLVNNGYKNIYNFFCKQNMLSSYLKKVNKLI